MDFENDKNTQNPENADHFAENTSTDNNISPEENGQEAEYKCEETSDNGNKEENSGNSQSFTYNSSQYNYAEYKENIKNMKAEMKRVKKEEKEKAKKETNASSSGGAFKLVSLASIAIICVAIGCALSIAVIAFFPSSDTSLLSQMVRKYGNSQTTIVQNGTGGTISIENKTESVASAVYKKAAQSVVGIRVVAKSNKFWEAAETIVSEGSGVVYSSDGLIVTNYHVISEGISDTKLSSNYEVRIFLDADLSVYYKAELLGYDAETDLALLKINVTGLTPIEIADYSQLTVGETAIAIGSPGGLDYMNSISEGIVSGIERDITTSSGISFALIQTTAAINPGNSGGALLNGEGELIGICVIKISDTDYEGMGFAINSDTIKTVIDRIMTEGTVERPQLGVTIRTDYDSSIANRYDYPAGAYVYEVTEGSAADKAGIQPNDIIYEFNGTELTSYNDLKKALNNCKKGDTVTIKIYRIDTAERLEVTCTLE